MSGRLAGKTAFITGAGRGIGRAIALSFAAEGAAIVGAARSQDELDTLVAEVATAGGRALAVACDVCDETAVQNAVEAGVARFGGLDLCVANAGVTNRLLPTDQLPSNEVRRVVEVNLFGVLNTINACLPSLRRRGGGHVVVIGSGAGRRAGPGFGPYAASKAAVAMLVRVMAQELRGDRIAVNEIVPGPVQTRLTGFGDGHDDALKKMFPGDEWVKQPEDVAPLALFVATLPTHGPTGQVFSLLGRDG